MNFPEMLYTIDILFAVFVFLFAAYGFRRGLSGELASVLTLLVLLCGLCFAYPAFNQFAAQTWVDLSPVLIQIVVSLVLFLISFLLYFLIRILLKRILKTALSDWVDKIAGCFAGLLRGALIGISLLAALSLLPSERLYEALSEKSAVGGWVCNTLTPWAHPRLMELPIFDRGE